MRKNTEAEDTGWTTFVYLETKFLAKRKFLAQSIILYITNQ